MKEILKEVEWPAVIFIIAIPIFLIYKFGWWGVLATIFLLILFN